MQSKKEKGRRGEPASVTHLLAGISASPSAALTVSLSPSRNRPGVDQHRDGEQQCLLSIIGAPCRRFLAVALHHDQEGVRLVSDMHGHGLLLSRREAGYGQGGAQHAHA
jgi:hypothetical protein